MPRTLPAIDSHQERLLARADRSADAAERGIRRVWVDLLRSIRAGGPWLTVYQRAAHILRQLPAVAHDVAADLVGLHRDAATWSAGKLATTLPRYARAHLLRRAGLLEDAASETDLLAGVLLPPLDAQAVARVVYGSGWWQTFQSLTTLGAPDSLAARIAAGVTQGLSVQRIAASIKPFVQDVQASARRVARTAGLYVAHEAERHVYSQLEGDLIAGYTVRAVIDRVTRPTHRARDGQQFHCRPVGNQRPMSECPHPPKEADGSWAFNCRCWLEPILSVG